MSPDRCWRLIRDGELCGARNMARDLALLEQVVAGRSLPVLRLYRWQPPCLSLGRHQEVGTSVDLDFCRRNGIDVVRRPTGGRAVLHHLELTYAVITPLAPISNHLQNAYTSLCRPLVAACRELGIDAELTTGEVNINLPGPRTAIPCFKAPAAGEVVVGGRKLIGSAMRFHRGVILQHGAILLDWDGRLQAGSMGLSDDSSLRAHITTFTEQLTTAPDREAVEDEIIAAYGKLFEIELTESEPTTEELQLEERLTETVTIDKVV
jgi:lipoate-protein ligase A